MYASRMTGSLNFLAETYRRYAVLSDLSRPSVQPVCKLRLEHLSIKQTIYFLK
jgi:hypothetical protein